MIQAAIDAGKQLAAKVQDINGIPTLITPGGALPLEQALTYLETEAAKILPGEFYVTSRDMLLVTVLGYFSNYVFGKYFLSVGERAIQRIPGIGAKTGVCSDGVCAGGSFGRSAGGVLRGRRRVHE